MVGVVVGTLLALFSLGVFVVGATLAGVAGLVRDDDGFLMSDVAAVETSTYALTSTSFEVHTSGPAEGLPDALLGEVKVAASSPNGTPLFVGIAASDDVERYLGDVRHETVTGFALRPLYEKSGTQALTTAPEERDIWATRATGTNGDLVWDVDDGDWTLVVMNADGTAGVDAHVAVGAEVPALDWLVPVLLSVGGTGLVVAVLVLVLAVRAGPVGGGDR